MTEIFGGDLMFKLVLWDYTGNGAAWCEKFYSPERRGNCSHAQARRLRPSRINFARRLGLRFDFRRRQLAKSFRRNVVDDARNEFFDGQHYFRDVDFKLD